MELYWGDIHNHCSITYGYGSLKNALAAARKQLDFCAITAHAMWPDIPDKTPELAYLVDFHEKGFNKIRNTWEAVKKEIESANVDGEFITFQGFEIHSSKYGDHHIISPDYGLELLYENTPRDAATRQKVRTILIPHHVGYTPGYRGANWNAFDQSISPVVEVYSKHGCAMNDQVSFPYYHTMGPRDGRGTVYAGLAAGKKFGFVASTDHHAGFPGSFGDGKMAVLANGKTKEDIWDAILQRRTYAVTGEKIACGFSMNGAHFGAAAERCRDINIAWNVIAADFIDKIVIYKNLNPIHIVNGEYLPDSVQDRRCKVRVEFGWGNFNEPFLWEIDVTVGNGAILSVETCFRGKSVLAPSVDMADDCEINGFKANIVQQTEHFVSVVCETFKNVSTLHSQTSAFILELDFGADTFLNFRINNRTEQISLQQLFNHSMTRHIGKYNSQAYKIHRAVPHTKYHAEGTLSDKSHQKSGDFYHMEVRQANGNMAYVSPVFCE